METKHGRQSSVKKRLAGRTRILTLPSHHRVLMTSINSDYPTNFRLQWWLTWNLLRTRWIAWWLPTIRIFRWPGGTEHCKWFSLLLLFTFIVCFRMAPTFFKILNFNLITGQYTYMNLVTDILGESICFLSSKLHKDFFGLFQYFSNVSWPTFLRNDGFGLVDRIFLVVICTPTPFIIIIWQETRGIRKPRQKIIPQMHKANLHFKE